MTTADTLELLMLDLVNAERRAAGLSVLELETNLNASAEDHSEWMLATNTFSHTGVGGSSPTQRMTSAGFDLDGRWSTAENIAVQSERGSAGFRDDVQNLHDSLMNSPGHRANILNPDLDYIGIGIEAGRFNYSSGSYDSVIVTQNFASTGGSVDLDRGAADPSPAPAALTAQAGQKVLRGTAGEDVLMGNGTANELRGWAGDDALYGKAGRDILVGGRGDDVLTGGKGADRFVFKSNGDNDRIADFQNNVDTIDLRNFDFSSVQSALQVARNVVNDVLFDFGNGDSLLVQNTTEAALQNDLLV